jgi:hypothetical protein
LSDTAIHPRLPFPASSSHPHLGIRPREGPQAANTICRRIDRLTLGLWLGGAALWMAGFVFGTRMPYSHPVGIACSALWWGIYFGCFGACIGSLLGMWMEEGRRTSVVKEQYTSTDSPTKWPRYVPLPREEMVRTIEQGQPGNRRGELARTEAGRGTNHDE